MPPVTQLSDLQFEDVAAFLESRGLTISLVAADADIPGSYWGAPEAGLVGNHLHVRPDTPIHSILHTACHWLCMDDKRRQVVDTNAGGDDVEEVAVCYLQCLLAEELPGYSRLKVFADMDLWGYNFRLGSTRSWFERDANDARDWLEMRGLPKAFNRLRVDL